MSAVVVVPCFNEERRLQPERFLAFPRAGVGVLFVDDGSRDRTREVLAAFCEGKRGLGLLALERNGGKAEAVRRGLLEALGRGATTVGYLDADLATPPEEMLRLLEAVQPPVEVALGSRIALLGHEVERRAVRHYLGRVFATAASVSLGLRVYDTQCGAKAFAATPRLSAALREPFHSRWVFDVELLGRLLDASSGDGAAGIVEVPLRQWRDVSGSKLGPGAMARAALDLAQLAARRRGRR